MERCITGKEKKSLREKVSFHNIARLPKQATEKFREHEILVQMKI